MDDAQVKQVPDVQEKILARLEHIDKILNRFWVVLVVYLVLTVIGWVIGAM